MDKITKTDMLKNARRSFVYLGQDLADDYLPGVRDNVKSSKDGIASLRSNYKKTTPMKLVKGLIDRSPFFRDMKAIKNKLFSNVAKGTFYKREDFDFGFGGGGGSDDFFSEGNFNMDGESAWETSGDSYDETSFDPAAESTAVAGANVANAVVGSAESQATLTIEAMKAMHADRQIILSDMHGSITKGFDNITSNFKILTDNVDVARDYYTKSLKYYEDNMGMVRDIKGLMLKNIIAEDDKSESNKQRNYMDFMMTGDMRSAFGDAGKRILREGDGRFMGNMGSIIASAMPMLMMSMKQDPFSMVKMGVKGGMDKLLGFDSADRITETLSNPGKLISSMARKMSLSDNKVASFVGDALRIRETPHDSIDTSQWGKRGRVHFDGITRQTIVEVIPTYLRKMTAALTKNEEASYNYNTGRFQTMHEIKNTFDNSKPVFEENHAPSLSGLIKANADQAFATNVDDKKLGELSKIIVKRLAENMYTLSDIGVMNYKQFMGITQLPENALAGDEFATIKNAIIKASTNSNEDDNRLFDRIDKSMDNYRNEIDSFYKQMQTTSRHTGLINLINGSNKINPFDSAPNPVEALGDKMVEDVDGHKIKDPKDFKSADFYKDLDVNKKVDSLKDLDLYADKEYANDAQREKGRIFSNDMSSDERESATLYYNKFGLKDYYKSRAIGNMNLKFMNKTGLGKTKTANELREKDPNNMRVAKNYMLESTMADEATANELKRKDEVAGKISEFKQKVADIQANQDMSSKEKTAAIKTLVSKDFKDFPEVRGLLGGAMVKITKKFETAFGGEDAGKNMMKLGGGALGAFIGLKFLKKNLPKAGILGVLGKAAGIGSVLAPVALASTAVAGTIYAGRNHIKKWMGADEDTSLFQATKEWMFGDGTDEKRGIVGGLVDKVKSGWTKVNDWVITKGWKPLVETMKKPFDGMMESVKGFWEENIKTTMGSMTSKVFDPIKEGFTKYIITPAGDAMKAVTSKIGGFFGGMFSGIKGMIDSFRKPKSRGASLREKFGETKRAGKFAEFNDRVTQKFGSGYNTDKTVTGKTNRENEYGMGYFYSQNDKKWSKLMIGGKGDSTSSAKLSGCGLMSMAMAVSNITDSKITPSDLSGVARRHKVTNDGIPFGFFQDVADRFELPVGMFNKGELSSRAVRGLLAKGHNIVALISTEVNTLHYVLLTKGKGNNVSVSDPDKSKSKVRPLALIHAMAKTFVVVYNDTKESSSSDAMAGMPPRRKESLVGKFKNALRSGAIAKESYHVRNELSSLPKDNVGGVVGGGSDDADSTGKKSFIDSSSERINARSSLKMRETVLKLSKNNRLGFKNIRREIATSLNGVSYNMEYIKRILAKKFGPLKDSESPTASYFKNIFAARSGGVLFKLKNFMGDMKDSVLSRIYDVYIDTKMMFEKTIDTIMKPFRLIGTAMTKVKDIGTWIGESLSKPFKVITTGIDKATKFILDPKNGLIPKVTGIISKGFESAFNGIIGTEQNPGFIRKGWRSLFGHGDDKGIIYNTISGVSSVVKDMWSGLYGTKEKPGILRNVGSTLLGMANGAVGLMGKGIGAGYRWATGKNLGIGKHGIKKVQIVGGHLDTVGTVGAVGAVDADSYKGINRFIGQKNSKLRTKLNKYTNTKTMRDADKVQDKKEKLTLAASVIANKGKTKKDKKDKGNSVLSSIGGMLKMALPAIIAGLSFLTMTKSGKDIVEKGYDLVGADGKSNAERLSYQAPKGATKWAIGKYGKKGMSVAKGVGTAGSKLGKGLSWAGKKTGGLLKNTKIGSNVADAITAHKSSLVTSAKTIGGKAMKAIVSGLTGIFSSKTVTKVLGPEVAEKILKGIPKLAKIGLKNSGKNSAKLSTRLLTWIPGIGQALDAMFFAYDLTSGMMGAPSMFGVSPHDVTFGMRMTAGIVKAIQGFAMSKGPLFIIGLIPTEMLAKFFYGLIGDKDELARLQASQDKHNDEYTKASEKYKDRTGKELDKRDYDDGKIDKDGKKVGFFKRMGKSMGIGGSTKNPKGGKSHSIAKTPYNMSGISNINGARSNMSEKAMLDMTVDDAKRHEGWRSNAYTDTTGHRTIGYGFNLEVMPKSKRDKYIINGMTRDEGESMLKKKVGEVWSDIKSRLPWVDNLDAVRQSVLVNMGYNMGVPGLAKWKGTLGMIKDGLYGKAANVMRGSLWAKQVKGRAVELSNSMESGTLPNTKHNTSSFDPKTVTKTDDSIKTLAASRRRNVELDDKHKGASVDVMPKTLPKATKNDVVKSGMNATTSNQDKLHSKVGKVLTLQDHNRRKAELMRRVSDGKTNRVEPTTINVDNESVVKGINETNKLLSSLLTTVDKKKLGVVAVGGGSSNTTNNMKGGGGGVSVGSDDYMTSIGHIIRR